VIKQKGLTLIEILIAWTMMAIFLAGAMWAQVEFLQKNARHREKMIAEWQLEAMAERLLANKTQNGRNRELNRWNEENALLLRNSKGGLYCSENVCEIRLSWGRGESVQLRV
jgi:prepilin-type N-terminal cleavage/methylation domain-containing protein